MKYEPKNKDKLYWKPISEYGKSCCKRYLFCDEAGRVFEAEEILDNFNVDSNEWVRIWRNDLGLIDTPVFFMEFPEATKIDEEKK